MDKIREEIRLIMAFVMTVIIILVFGRIQTKPQPTPTEKPPVSVATETDILPPQQVFDAIQQDFSPIPIKDEEKEYDNNRYFLTVGTTGGYIKSIGINKYQRRNESLFSIFDNSQIFLDSTKEYGKINYQSPIWDAENGLLKFIGNTGNNVYIQKELNFPSDLHTFKTSINIDNKSNHSLNYLLQAGSIPATLQTTRGEREFVPPEILIKTDNQVVKISPTRLKENFIYENTQWIALRQRYSLLMVQVENGTKSFVTKEDNFVKFGFLYENLNIGNKKIDLTFYAGPSDYFVCRNEIKDISFFKGGFFVYMGRFLFTLLSYIHKVIPNWGWAIIFLTLIIKILFFPLTRNSMKSMKALQTLRPYLTEIQKKYKDNPQQMQKEMMGLYRDYKINPLGGCIPMLLQFPIFIGFFLALRNSIFFRGASFGLWINDLSLPDSLFQVSGFNINILPIIMAVTALYQQKFTPQDPSQKTLTLMMPIIFLFLFYNFSSGLLLYWITMNMAGLVEQYFIHKK